MSDFNTLEEQAKKRRTYNPGLKDLGCPVIKIAGHKERVYTGVDWSHNECPHKKVIKKHLFTSSYEVCEDCGKEL